jgi:MFS transporter, YNFM family, putative membrane transport protein
MGMARCTVTLAHLGEECSASDTAGAFAAYITGNVLTTPLAGAAVQRYGTQVTLWSGLATAAVALPLLVTPYLPAVLLGMVLMGVGTFFAQATATGFVSRAATTDRGSASGIYLACYFFGGLVGSAILGQLFDRYGWTACVVGVGLSLLTAAALTLSLHMSAPEPSAEPLEA